MAYASIQSGLPGLAGSCSTFSKSRKIKEQKIGDSLPILTCTSVDPGISEVSCQVKLELC
jgi:hypothetical protein